MCGSKKVEVALTLVDCDVMQQKSREQKSRDGTDFGGLWCNAAIQ
jgi:hypothetical protein